MTFSHPLDPVELGLPVVPGFAWRETPDGLVLTVRDILTPPTRNAVSVLVKGLMGAFDEDTREEIFEVLWAAVRLRGGHKTVSRFGTWAIDYAGALDLGADEIFDDFITWNINKEDRTVAAEDECESLIAELGREYHEATLEALAEAAAFIGCRCQVCHEVQLEAKVEAYAYA